MKLFMKEHVGLVLIQCLQVALFCLIIFLSGFDDYSILLYGIFISFCLLFGYLAFHYYNRRHVYKKLSTYPRDMQQLLERTDEVPMGEALDGLMKSHYQRMMGHLKEAQDNQAQHLKFIDRWVHQMKTPLSVIELMAKELDEPESSNMREETEQLKDGLNTVLYMARMRTIQEDFHIKPVPLEKIIQDINQANKRLYIRSKVYPHIKIEKDKPIVETDEKWLFFILNQVVHNAVKYTNYNSQRIDMSVYKKKGEAVLEIVDYGVGIPEHDKRRIFQAFYTGDNGRHFRESTGMGLYLVKEVLDYLDHKIEVESTVDAGTTFRIYFSETQTVG